MTTRLKTFQKGRVLVSGPDIVLVVMLAKNADVVCPCPKNLPGATLKSFGLMALAKAFQDSLVLTVSCG